MRLNLCLNIRASVAWADERTMSDDDYYDLLSNSRSSLAFTAGQSSSITLKNTDER